MHKIGCFRPWTSYYVENSTQSVKPCCWVRDDLAILDDNSTLENTFYNDNWEKMRRDMVEANGALPKQCPIYCQHKHDQEWFYQAFGSNIQNWFESGERWNGAPFEFSATIANACNLKCKMCWIFDDFDYEISQRGLNTVLDQLKEKTKNNKENGLPMLDINLVGGEVFYAKPLRNSLYNLINDENAGKTFRFNFITNATIWDQKFWDILETKPNALSHITISIDGHNRETYHSIRGVDKFDTVLLNIDKMIEWRNQRSNNQEFWPIYINSIIQTETYPHLKEIIDIFLNKEVVLSFIPLVIDYKPDSPWQCFNLEEHRKPCLNAINDAITYIDSFNFDENEWKKGWCKYTIKTSLERNKAYLEEIIEKNIKTR